MQDRNSERHSRGTGTACGAITAVGLINDRGMNKEYDFSCVPQEVMRDTGFVMRDVERRDY
jgi:hypothetical protein